MNDRPATSTVGDLISVAPVATVIALDEVEALRRRLRAEGEARSPETAEALHGLVGQYLIAEDDNRRAVETILESLARPGGPGGAFLVRGVHGCGKSHLLAVLALLCEFPAAWNLFAEAHPELARLARAFGPDRGLLVVAIDLEHYGADSDLESIIFASIERELEARGAPGSISPEAYVLEVARQHIVPHYPDFEAFVAFAASASWQELAERDPGRAAALARGFVVERGLPITFHRSRSEAIAELRAVMADAGLSGVVLLIDELGLFLSSKPRAGLDADAAFLQFLAQRTRSMPLWMVASVQRGLEDIGDIDRRTLRQIQDRFRTDLSLNIAQLRAVIERRLIARHDPAVYRATIEEMYRRLAGDGAVPSFSRDELTAFYPLHPMTLECLEALAGSFLSKTRTLISFVQHAVAAHLTQPAERLLTLDSVFDYFESDFQQIPEAANHWRAYAFLRDNMTRFASRATLAQKLAKALMLTGLAGQRWTAREYTDALIGSDLPANGRTVDAVRDTLESLRRRGAYVEMTPGADGGEALYFLEVSSAVPEAARRRLAEIDATLGPDDGRVIEAAMAA